MQRFCPLGRDAPAVRVATNVRFLSFVLSGVLPVGDSDAAVLRYPIIDLDRDLDLDRCPRSEIGREP